MVCARMRNDGWDREGVREIINLGSSGLISRLITYLWIKPSLFIKIDNSVRTEYAPVQYDQSTSPPPPYEKEKKNGVRKRKQSEKTNEYY